MTIKEVLDNLSDSQKRQLYYAFESEVSQYIELPDSKFIGVNIGHLKHLNVELATGVWAVGQIKGKEDE